jgi:hypothetical protein
VDDTEHRFEVGLVSPDHPLQRTQLATEAPGNAMVTPGGPGRRSISLGGGRP